MQMHRQQSVASKRLALSSTSDIKFPEISKKETKQNFSTNYECSHIKDIRRHSIAVASVHSIGTNRSHIKQKRVEGSPHQVSPCDSPSPPPAPCTTPTRENFSDMPELNLHFGYRPKWQPTDPYDKIIDQVRLFSLC